MTNPPPPTPPLPPADGGGQLLPCPCCGGEARRTIVDGWEQVDCRDCLLRGGLYAHKEGARGAWNRRAEVSRLSSALAAARERETALRDDCARLRGACKEAVMLILEADATAQEDNYAKASADVRIVLCFAIAATEALALAPSPEPQTDKTAAENERLRAAINHALPLLRDLAGEVYAGGKTPSAEECLEWLRAALAPSPKRGEMETPEDATR